MDIIAETGAPYVFCRTLGAGGAGSPGPVTALGVFNGIQVACEHVFGESSLEQRKVLVQGVGNVGETLIEHLLDAGTEVVFSEVDETTVQRFRDERASVLSMQDPFRRSWNMLGGMEHLLICYGTNPKLVHQIARIVTDYTLDAIALGAELGADLISMDGDLAHETGMLMSPAHFREFIKPYYAEIVDFVHGKGLKIFKHTDGNHWKIMEDLIEVGLDGIHPIQPQSLDLAEVKRQIGHRICLLGNIDCRETLVTKSTREVEEEVRQAIRAAGPGGGYILSSSNTIHPEVTAENYIAMVKATHEYGVYGTHDLC